MDSEVVYVGIVDNKTFEGPAKRQGMNGEYIILEYEDWTIDSTALLFDEVKKTKNHNDKSLLVMKDGVVSHYLFDSHEDMIIVSKIKGETEKKQILEMYHQWKRQLQQCQRDIESLFNQCTLTGEECFQTLQNYYAEHKIKEELSCVCNLYAGKLCYRYFEEYKDNNQPDKAAYFLELRAELDTTNELWQRQAAKALPKNRPDYLNKTILYYQRILRQAEIKYGKNSNTVAEYNRSIGLLYHKVGDNEKALECFQRLVAIQQSLYGDDHIITQKSIREMGYIASFIPVSMRQYIFTATTVDGETPAKAQGLSGEYVVLEFGDWSIDSTSSLFDVNTALKGKPKTILIMKDDVISQHYFENTIGVQLELKQVGEAEKNRIKKLYHQWKKKQ
jgi:tetratricopeptide (TPR) repeat protein